MSEQQEHLQFKSVVPAPSPPQLTAIIIFRLFAGDELQFTLKDLFQWMDYMRFAGVDHFYLYDNCLDEEECVEHSVSALPYVTYVPWHVDDYRAAQVPAYNHHLMTHFPQASYEILLDMDEYPYMSNPEHMKQNFLKEYALQKQSPQVLLRTIFFGGPSVANSQEEQWRVLRYTHRRERAERDGRTKPLYQPSKVNTNGTQNLHEMAMLTSSRTVGASHSSDAFKYSPYDLIMGYDKMEDESVLRLNHYWCERLSDDEDAPLVHDDGMVDVIGKVEDWKTAHNGVGMEL
jgi:hypothetical protein